ncbi:hypothetical protein HAX54_026648, partial [Datura stramonium]|nr:hypothetical protein [Datura stramonium]
KVTDASFLHLDHGNIVDDYEPITLHLVDAITDDTTIGEATITDEEGINLLRSGEGHEDHAVAPAHTQEDNIQPDEVVVVLKRSVRSIREPLWHKDYVTHKRAHGAVLYPIYAYLSYEKLSTKFQSFWQVFQF